ncbi:MAG TPA: hypothetical protein VG940_00625 [Gemmatimonadales bacterium]|nr:hypothetical protein [Gemmatimonadales bacterium]
MRPSNPALLAASRSLFERRRQLTSDWAARLSEQHTGSRDFPPALLERELRLLVDLVAEMAGPLRREAREIWDKAASHYGRTAAARGLVAGEVVDEFSAFREILTRELAAGVAALRPRRAMAVLLHLHRVIDQGIVQAVAGYTDALVAELFIQDGVPTAGNALEAADIERQLSALEQELQQLLSAPAGGM